MLVVGTAKAGNAEQEYLLGQWTVDGSSTTEYSKLLYHFNKKQQRSKLRRMAVPVCGAILMVIALILALTDQTTLAASFLAWACILWVFSVARDDI